MNVTVDNVILFDGECNFCNSTINFIINWDKKSIFSFSSLHSSVGQSILVEYGLPIDSGTMVLVSNGKVYLRSTAVFHIISNLAWPIKGLAVLSIIPVKLRDSIYMAISRRRKNIIKKQINCKVPSQAILTRFI